MKISLSNLFNYFSVSGNSKQIKNFPQKKWYFDHNPGGGPTQKYDFFDAALDRKMFMGHPDPVK